MTFTPRMMVAVRVMALNRAEGWFSEDRLAILGIRRRTVLALCRKRVVEFRFNDRMRNGGVIGVEWRLAPLVVALFNAVRA